MRTFTRYTKGLGNAALGLRASKLGQYWDWVALAAVGAETADTMKLLTEYANAGDTIESQYAVDFTAPLNGPWDLEIVVISTGATIAVGSTSEFDTARILGLVLHNHVEDDIVRDANGLKTSSTIYCYDSAANATTHDKATGLIAKYTVTPTFTNRLMTLLKSVQVV